MSNKLVMITGSNGMAGSTLIDWILENQPEYKVLACIRRHSNMENVAHLKDNPKVTFEQFNLEDSHEVSRTIEFFQPEKIFHLGAQSFVPQSWKSPAETMDTNIHGTLNVLEAVRRFSNDTVVQIAGSSEEYGLVYPNETPIKESNPLRPLSPYGVSKIAQENIGYVYNKSYKCKTILSRAFNHEGIRRGEEFITSQICKQAAEISLGLREHFSLGNLDAIRDFTDVRDVVRAYWLLTEKGEFGVPYNIASDKPYMIKGLVHTIAKQANISEKVVQDPNRMRPSDVEILHGDYTRLKEATGWEPEYDFLNDTLVGMYENWVYKLTNKPTLQFFISKED